MSDSSATELQRYGDWLVKISRRLQAQSKALAQAGDDPFLQRKAWEAANAILVELGIKAEWPSSETMKSIDERCVRCVAEFWDEFMKHARSNGWEVHGSTGRRLVARGFFVELSGSGIHVEDLPGMHTPFVPRLVEQLKPVVNSLIETGSNVGQFADSLIAAYEDAGGSGEISLERIYRGAVLNSQRPSFWKNSDAKAFQPLTRPMFRARLSRLLAGNAVITGGRTVRLGTTTERRDAWEILSDAEGHVIQVGRLAIVAAGNNA
jgi:hypothetical protein